ncbi:hypothetical protein LIN78_13875 [Leeia sp. TBRC 13508]|uniref:Uncharacterized protein n=1 Tax=Leeia speluncae TaxID=2884804 RepID=A0ABS8D9M1_9NEIS|nr:hypothetical protein [Leeia speluncae]MCB6184631.1 hypothetical protein [Leeia speluncae]
MAIFRQKKTAKKNQPDVSLKVGVIAEIIRVASRLDETMLPKSYRVIIFGAIIKFYHELPLRDVTWLEDQLNALGEPDDASEAVVRMAELQAWVKDSPQLVLTLMIGLAAGKGDEFAWGLMRN